jgi:hypothetical protein
VGFAKQNPKELLTPASMPASFSPLNLVTVTPALPPAAPNSFDPV